MTNFYQSAFDAAVAELDSLQGQRDEIQKQVDSLDERIEKVRQGALGLAALVDIDFEEMKRDYPRVFSEEHDQKLGITEAVRLVLREYDFVLTPVELKERVLRISPAVAGHKNPMASLHAVLRRLVDTGEVMMADFEDSGRTVFGWIGPTSTKEEIKSRLQSWFTNPDEVWERNAYRWKDREEGVPHKGAPVDVEVLRRSVSAGRGNPAKKGGKKRLVKK